MTAEQKIKYIPAGGIAAFVMSDEDIQRLEAEELKEQYGTTGIAQFSTVGKKMANFGRHGDDTVAHVETGELIVPRALIDNNPELKESIFSHLRELGVEDPERYVVGAAKNSINPETGLPEFFLGKFLKKISRGLSSTAKGVGKALKKAAPIILPIALAMTPLGPIYGAALGSGIGTLVNGGSAEDAFKSALIAGASGAAFSGARGTLSADLANPMGRIGQTATGFGNTLTGEGFTGDGNLFSSYRPEVTNADGTVKVTELSGANTDLNLGPSADGSLQQANYLETLPPKNAKFIDMTKSTGEVNYLNDVMEPITSSTSGSTSAGTPSMYEKMKTFGSDTLDTLGETYDKAGDYMFRGGDTAKDIVANQNAARTNAIQESLKTSKLAGLDVSSTVAQSAAISSGDAAFKAAGTGMLTKYGPSVALAGLASYAGGAYDVPEPESDEEEDVRTGMNAYNENPERFRLGDLDLRYIQGDPRVASKYPFYRPRNVQRAAQGGQIFPRRVGGIMPNEGIPNKDSVRAMLMPGEFVMTTDAVKGLGGGDMNKGINNMYGVMRNLEQRGRRA